ncbi:MAG: carboxylate--amine ligase [Desulfococcaceae bacterium]|jgi:hypothetical protein|nr:carboxylate--amine ligase [Desulfococcaceae bacterium]
MNIVYLSPDSHPSYYLFCLRLYQAGGNVLGIGEVHYDNFRQELKEALTEYYRVENMADYEQLLRTCGYFTHAYGRLDRVASHNEYLSESEARLRTDFNIPGIKIHRLARFNRKSEMKKLFQKAGVAVAKGKVLKNAESAKNFVRDTGYPVIFKPDRGPGTAATLRVDTDSELEKFLRVMPSMRYYMEACTEGQLCSFDGLTDREGGIVFHTVHVYSQGIMETLKENKDFSYYSLREIPEDLETAGRSTVRAFDIREQFFHIEFFRTPENKIVGLEVNTGPPGGFTTDMFNYANNIDVYRGWAEILLHNHFPFSCSRPYHCGYIGRKLSKNYMYSHRDIMQKYGYLIVFHGPVEAGFCASCGNYAYIVNSQTPEEMQDVIRFVQATA